MQSSWNVTICIFHILFTFFFCVINLQLKKKKLACNTARKSMDFAHVKLTLFFPVIKWNCHIYHYCCSLLLIHHHYVLMVGQHLSVCLELKVLTTFSSVSHRDLGSSSPFFAQMFLYTTPTTKLCLSVFALLDCFLHSATKLCFGMHCSKTEPT